MTYFLLKGEVTADWLDVEMDTVPTKLGELGTLTAVVGKLDLLRGEEAEAKAAES